MEIFQATPAHCAAITDIYNDAIRHTDAVWNEQTVDIANRIAWMERHQQQGFPVLVAEINGQVAGYTAFTDWRPFAGYRHTVEHCVYVASGFQGRGVGRQLMEALIAEARKCHKHVMVAAIESSNQNSLALHHRLGFQITGQMPQVGTKFGRWLDLTFMQLQLDTRAVP